MKKREVWFDARDLELDNNILSLVFEKNFDHLLIRPELYKKEILPKRMSIAVHVEKIEQLDELEDVIIFSENEEILREAKEKGLPSALFKVITNKDDLEYVYKNGAFYDYVCVLFYETTNIPLELLIAAFQKKNCVLMKFVNNVQDAEIVFGVMEKGSDGIIFTSREMMEIEEMSKLIEKANQVQLNLETGKVVDIKHIGMGCRVCVDTTSILDKNEGMLIGSTSTGGILISSETHHLPYMELRPFRVNAGAVHSYTWFFDETIYLSELKSGMQVMAVNTEGRGRAVSVGRKKMEIRPLLKIEVESKSGKRINVIVQDDWHIRILGPKGKVHNASAIKIGDELLAYFCEGGRHVGIKTDEFLEEE